MSDVPNDTTSQQDDNYTQEVSPYYCDFLGIPHETHPQALVIFGMKVVEDDSIPNGEIHAVIDGTVVGKITGIGDFTLQPKDGAE